MKFETKCQLKSGISHLSALLVRLFNFIIPKGTFPDSWSTGMITPIFKSVNRSDLQITEAFVLFCPILNTRLNVYFTIRIFYTLQNGFLRGYRTTDYIFILMRTLIDKYVKNENRDKLFCSFVDFQQRLTRYGMMVYCQH